MAEAKSGVEILEEIDLSINEMSTFFDSIEKAAIELIGRSHSGDDDVWKLSAIKGFAKDGSRLAQQSLSKLAPVHLHFANDGSSHEPVA
jgi:hypothetical protein